MTGRALHRAAQVRCALWDRASLQPRDKQLEMLLRNCHAAAKTEIGRRHDLGRVRTYDQFRMRMPLRTYADYEPMLERMRRGERDVLWPGLIAHYGQSSGTSHTAAQHKFLPISDTQVRWQQGAGFDVLARYLVLAGDRDFTGGFTLGLFPPAVVKADGPVGITSNPGLMMKKMAWPATMMSLPRSPIKEMAVYDEKLKATAAAYLDYDVRAISGTTCWFSIFFDHVLDAARASGRNVTHIREIWPNLRALFGGGVHAEPYRKLIDERVGGPTMLMDNYNATEGGIFAVTDRRDDAGMLVIPDRGVFYEFVPRAEHGKPNARRYALWEVEQDTEYSVVVSTSSGLFGYYIGDFVRFTSVAPHRIVFTGRASGVLSLTQELTTHIEIEKAVATAVAREPCSIVDFSASSEVGVDGSGRGRYVLFVEFDKPPSSLSTLATSFDEGLRKNNRVYREHRAADVAILPPVVVPLARGSVRRFMEEIGQTSPQHKFPRIIDDRRRDILRRFAEAPTP